jgi:hypothetical protein
MLNTEWNATMQLENVMACKVKQYPVFLVCNMSYNRLLLYSIQLNLRCKIVIKIHKLPRIYH